MRSLSRPFPKPHQNFFFRHSNLCLANHVSKKSGDEQFALELVMKAITLYQDELKLKESSTLAKPDIVITVSHASKAIELSDAHLEKYKLILRGLSTGHKSILCILLMIAKDSSKTICL
jgi:hypothetical protein